jgi:hypothetical protein
MHPDFPQHLALRLLPIVVADERPVRLRVL